MTQSPEQRDGNGTRPAKGEKSRLRDRTVTITISLPKAVFGVLFSLFVLVWVFIFGIMLGRGHNPEEVVPELSKVMPTPANPQAAPAPVDEVLQPRDLKYHDSLKGKNASGPPRAATPSPVPQQSPTATPRPVTPKPAEPSTTPPVRQTPAPASASGQDQTVYNYVYQVAALNDMKQAQTLRQKLQNDGISAKVTETQANGKTWFRILVYFKGKPEDTRMLREKLAAHKIPDIILRDKKAAN